MPVTIIQARLGSTRLPGKALADVAGKPMLERVIERARACRGVEEVVIATTTEPRDEPLVKLSRRLGLKIYRGSESDVLDRIYQAARQAGARHILRVTPDCPLLDPQVVEEVLELYRGGRYDFVSNTLGRRYPDGLDTELFSFEALETAWKEGKLASEREHVTAYIIKHPEKFRLGLVEAPADYAEMKWSVDTEEDLAFVRKVYEQLGGKGIFSMKDVLGIAAGVQPARRNGAPMVNEGYYRSLADDPAPEIPSLGLERSKLLAARAGELIPGGSQTLSKGPTQFVQGIAPSFLVKGDGCRVWDLDGNEYMDCAMALGPVILGYKDPDVDAAVHIQMEDGASFSLPHPLEVEVAERLSALIPCAEMVRFGKNGSDVTAGAVRLARGYTGRDIIASCYDDQTEILTLSGFKLIKDVREGETVATLNPVTQDLEYQRVLKTFAYPYAGDLFLFEGKRLSLSVTPDHRIYRGYRPQKGPMTFRLIEARHLEKRRSPTWMTCASKWNCESPKVFTIPHAQIKGWKTKGVSEFPIAAFLRFLGWYLAEGSVAIRKPGTPKRYSHYRISLAQFDGHNGLVERMKEAIQTLGFIPRQEGHHITFDSKELALYLSSFGHAGEKRVPPWVKTLSPDLLRIFLDALVDGDGTRSGGRIRFYTSSKGLADDFQELTLKTGRAAYVAEKRNTGFARGKSIYHVTVSKRTTFECRAARKVPYQGMVYCVRVPNGIVLVRRKGRCVWSGNSGYHGWQDWCIGITTRNLGVPESVRALTRPFEYNNLESLRKIFREHPGQVAGVIMEPVGVVEPEKGFLEGVQDLARREGALLIFDEVLTGFRVSLGGAQAYFGVTPDLACFGKAISNGLPLSALVGRRDVMSRLEEVFFSFTFGGETLSLAAAMATLRKLEEKKVPDHLWRQGRRLQDGFRALARRFGLEQNAECAGLPPRTVVNFKGKDAQESLSMKSLFQQECIKRGVLFTGSQMLSFRHGQAEVDFILRVYAAAMPIIAGALKKGNWSELLESEPVQPVFRQV